MGRFAPLASLLLVAASASSAVAQDTRPGTFDRNLAIGAYGTGWVGAYAGAGVGARIRWEPFERLGIDLFTEHLIVESPGGLRHDHPIGFNVYVPFALGPNVRVRPLFGFCAVFSLVEPEQEDGPRADDVLFGIHGGAGLEWSPFRDVSLFLDVQAIAYLGHDRAAGGWTGMVDEEYSTFGVAQASLGAEFHFDL